MRAIVFKFSTSKAGVAMRECIKGHRRNADVSSKKNHTPAIRAQALYDYQMATLLERSLAKCHGQENDWPTRNTILWEYTV